MHGFEQRSATMHGFEQRCTTMHGFEQRRATMHNDAGRLMSEVETDAYRLWRESRLSLMNLDTYAQHLRYKYALEAALDAVGCDHQGAATEFSLNNILWRKPAFRVAVATPNVTRPYRPALPRRDGLYTRCVINAPTLCYYEDDMEKWYPAKTQHVCGMPTALHNEKWLMSIEPAKMGRARPPFGQLESYRTILPTHIRGYAWTLGSYNSRYATNSREALRNCDVLIYYAYASMAGTLVMYADVLSSSLPLDYLVLRLPVGYTAANNLEARYTHQHAVPYIYNIIGKDSGRFVAPLEPHQSRPVKKMRRSSKEDK